MFSLRANLRTENKHFFHKCAWRWCREEGGGGPAANTEPCVCVPRARSMTEQQEPAEDTGLLSTQDLDPSKDDGTHGHFRQISQKTSPTGSVGFCLWFYSATHTHTIHLYPVHGHELQPQQLLF